MNLPPPPGGTPPPSIPAVPSIPPAPSRVSLVLGLVAFMGLLVGIGLVWRWATAPEPCANAELTSERFGYCITVPNGWRVAEVSGEDLPADQLFRPDGDATVMIQAVETAHDVDAFTEDVRALQQAEGLATADVRTTIIAGADARRWDATFTAGAGTIRARTIVFERDGIAWRVQFADTEPTFTDDVRGLSRILDSWRFR